VDLLLDRLVAYLPHGPKLYPEDMLSDQAERFFVAELIRESLIDLLRQELPYCSAVIIDKFVEEPRRCAVYATIHVERASQRAIVIGHKGGMIKEIGRRSRTAASEFMGCPVDLKLHVDVSPGWTKDIAGIKKMGYE
jgi:GTP-binding protein Era